MLSILIPEYNYDCTKLVKGLAGQCCDAGIVFEIIVMDDASTLYKAENRCIVEIPGCLFIESEHNLGLAKTRNRLAAKSQYQYLLMIDCDAEIKDQTYIRNYLKYIGQAQVVAGGISYSIEKPDSDRSLRWYYGRKRESLPAKVLNQNPYKSSLSFNLMMTREVNLQCPYDESFKDYGHEDSVLGYTLKQKSISVLHIDNPLIHKCLDTNEVFLSKSLKAVEKYVTNPAFKSDGLIEQIKIFRVFRKIQAIGLCKLFALKFRIARKFMEHNLFGKHPSLFIFDIYRLGYLCNLSQSQQKIVPTKDSQK